MQVNEMSDINRMELRDGKSIDTTPAKRQLNYNRRISNQSNAMAAMIEDEEPPQTIATPKPRQASASTQSTPIRHMVSQRVSSLKVSKMLPKSPTPSIVKRPSVVESNQANKDDVNFLHLLGRLIGVLWFAIKWMVKVPSRLLILLPLMYLIYKPQTPESINGLQSYLTSQFQDIRANLTALSEMHRLLKQVDRKATTNQELLEELSLQVQLKSPVQYQQLSEEKKTLPTINYAAFSAGARIIRYAGMTSVKPDKPPGFLDRLLSVGQATNTYYNSKLHPPEVVLEQSQLEPGRCWHTHQQKGYLTIVLAQPIKISKVQYIHIQQSQWVHDKPPQKFDVYGLRLEPDMREMLQVKSKLQQVYRYVYDNFALSLTGNSSDLYIGSFSDQLYPDSMQVYDVLQFRFDSQEQVCLYQVVVQGVE